MTIAWGSLSCDTTDIRKRAGTIYYVDGVSGNDANDGLTPETAVATISQAISLLSAGDTVVVGADTYDEAVDLDEDSVTMLFQAGVVITNTSGNPPLVVSADRCVLDCPGGKLFVTPPANSTGVTLSGDNNVVHRIRVSCGSSADLGFDLTGDGNEIYQCRCRNPLVAAYKLQGNNPRVDDACTTGEPADSSIGFWLTSTCDGARLKDCGSSGHATAGFQIDANVTDAVLRQCDSGPLDGHFIDNGSGTFLDVREHDTSEQHEHTYPRPDGEGTAGDPVTVQSEINDETGADTNGNYWGDAAQIIPPAVVTRGYFIKGVNLFAQTANDEQRLSFYRAVYQTLSVRNGGNAWDEGATALTINNPSFFAVGDYVWIRTPGYQPNGEIVKVTDVTGNVVTIARNTEASGRTGLHWDHTTNDGGNEEMYLCWRDENAYHTSDVDYSAGFLDQFSSHMFLEKRRLDANDAWIVRMQNGTDEANSVVGVTAIWSD